jgi:predicted outer membrane protein
MTRAMLAGGLLFATAGGARAADTPYDPRGGRAQEVVTQLHQRNQDLIAAAQVAQARASSDAVKDYAARVIRDRQAADADLMTYAQQQGMNVSEIQTGAGALPHGPLATARLTNVSADRFDPYFARDMVAREQAAVDEAVQAQKLAQGPQLAGLIARDVVPSLRQEEASAASLTSSLPPLRPPAVQQPGEPSVANWTNTGADTHRGLGDRPVMP